MFLTQNHVYWKPIHKRWMMFRSSGGRNKDSRDKKTIQRDRKSQITERSNVLSNGEKIGAACGEVLLRAEHSWSGLVTGPLSVEPSCQLFFVVCFLQSTKGLSFCVIDLFLEFFFF